MRAFLFGFGSLLLASTFRQEGLTGTQIGGVLTALLAGNAVMNWLVARRSARWGPARFYAGLYLLLAGAGLMLGSTRGTLALALAALTGVLSPEVLESGPFTSLEQALLPELVAKPQRVRCFAIYNAVAAGAGSLGALAAGASGTPLERHWFLLYVPLALVGAAVAGTLRVPAQPVQRLPDLRAAEQVRRLAALFALDSFAGGFVVQSFLAYWLALRFSVPVEGLAPLFALGGVCQVASFALAVRLAPVLGLVNTMVFTHLPSNLLLMGVAVAPSLPVAAGLLLARQLLSQMDVPTRQAFLADLVPADQRASAAAVTNNARLLVRPLGPPLVGLLLSSGWVTAPLLVAGGLKSVYDLALFWNFRHAERVEEPPCAG